MGQKRFAQRLRSTIAPVADRLGLGNRLRQGFVEVNLLGERAKFLLRGRPDPSTAIILAGSGRSGTTWLTEVLCTLPGVQQIFEPLLPLVNTRVRAITGWDVSDPHVRAVYLRPDNHYPSWQELWQHILTGRMRNYWTDYERNSYFPDRFLVKEIRANLMLGYLYRQFQPRIVYIMRHPCAVVQSRLSITPPWHADVQDILQQEVLVHDHLQPWIAQIAAETDLVGAHAVWWAVENHIALQQLQKIPHFLIYYENLVMQPDVILSSLLPWLGYTQMPSRVKKLLLQPSRMSNKHISYQDKQERLSRWQGQFSAAEQQRILNWAHRFGLTMYDETPTPVN